MINNGPVQPTTPPPPPAAPALPARPTGVGPAFTPGYTAPPPPAPPRDTSTAAARPAHPAAPVDARASFGNRETETGAANPEQETATSGDDRWGTRGFSAFADVTGDGASTTAAGGESSAGRISAVAGFVYAAEGGNEADTEYNSVMVYGGAGFNSNTTQVGEAEASQTDSLRGQVGIRIGASEGDGASGMSRRIDPAATALANSLRGGN